MFPKHKTFKADWKGNNSMIELEVPVFIFTDEKGVHYCFLPSLDLIGYGYSEEEARQSLNTVLAEYLDYTTKHNTLLKDLKKHGWHFEKHSVSPPNLGTQITKNEDLNNLLSSRDFRSQRRNIQLPALV